MRLKPTRPGRPCRNWTKIGGKLSPGVNDAGHRFGQSPAIFEERQSIRRKTIDRRRFHNRKPQQIHPKNGSGLGFFRRLLAGFKGAIVGRLVSILMSRIGAEKSFPYYAPSKSPLNTRSSAKSPRDLPPLPMRGGRR